MGIKFKYVILICLFFTWMGCSTQKNDNPAPQQANHVEQESQAPTIGPSEEGEMPVKIQVESAGKNDSNEDILVIHIEPLRAFDGKVLMKLVPNEGTETSVGLEDIELPELNEGKTAIREVALHGEHPAVDIEVRLLGDGFAMMVKESWPEKLQPRIMDKAVRQDLPAPIEIQGVKVDKGVEVGR